MNVFESLGETSNKAVNLGEKYIESSHQYLKLKIFQQSTAAMSLLGKMLLIGAFLFISFLFLAISAALAIGYMLDNFALGTLIVGGTFLLIALVIYLLRHRIDNKFIKVMSKNFYD